MTVKVVTQRVVSCNHCRHETDINSFTGLSVCDLKRAGYRPTAEADPEDGLSHFCNWNCLCLYSTKKAATT